jgi:endo-1,4-beta-xylanase
MHYTTMAAGALVPLALATGACRILTDPDCTRIEGHAGAGGAGRIGGEGSAGSEPEVPPEDQLTLHQKYADHFPIGAAVDLQSYTTHAELLTTHFNSITTENEMKLGSLQRSEGAFRFTTADTIVDFASSNGMAVRGHALVWHRQNPAWLFSDGEGGTASPVVLMQRMESHITNVMTHFAGRVEVWDVVNEAIMNDGRLRTGGEERDDQKSRWYEILGESYIAEAFRIAHEADPGARLFYNDYYNYSPARQQAIYALLRGLLEDGVPVHGVGLQCHLNIAPSDDPEHQSYYQTVENLEQAIELYSSLGLEVQITELDVSLYIAGNEYDESSYYTLETFTEELQQQQAERYREFFDMFREHSHAITGVTFWGIADDNTWLSEFSSGRRDFPLLFDTNHQPKPALEAVMDF